MKTLSMCKKNVEALLQQWFDDHPLATKPFFKALASYTLRGGKRIRAWLVFETYRLARKHDKYEQAAWDTAAIMELLQSYLLIHDDWMDDDTLRRGKPTLHVFFQKRYQQKTAEGLAILGGDFLHAMAMKKIAQLKVPEHVRKHILEEISGMLMDVIYGQTLDLVHVLENGSLKKYKTIATYKTAVYSFQAPIILGLLLAEQNPSPVFTALGNVLGIAFQMQDDYLDIMSTKIGKDNLSDLRQGKANSMTILLWQNVSEKEKRYLLSLKSKAISQADIANVQKLVKQYGLDTLMKRKIQKYLHQAQNLIKKLPVHYQQAYQELLHYLQEREY